jgi:hypothetical protein
LASALLEGAAGIFERGGQAAATAEAAEETVRDLHAKIGELAVANDFWQESSSPGPGSEAWHDRTDQSQAVCRGAIPTDQRSQFTSFDWTDRLKRAKTKISLDGKALYLDNIFVEPLWRTIKYECVYLHAWETGSQARAGVGRWITFYNHQRPHAAHGGQPPAVVYFNATQTDQQVQAVP